MPSAADDLQTWIIPDQVFDGTHLLSNHAAWIENGCITDVARVAHVPVDSARRVVPGTLTPGFLDLQVNGGGGVLLNATPTPDGIADIAAAHRKDGTAAIFPTVITDSPDVLSAAVDAVIDAKDQTSLAGLHIEGPHLNPAKKGVHSEAYIRPIEEKTFALVGRVLASDIPVLITVAPEMVGVAAIRRLVDMGARVSIGHSDATADETIAAFEAGACSVTHLFNAMSPMTSRAPGVTGAAIRSDAWCGIIADGLHVDDRMMQLAFAARPRDDRMVLVSDAMPTVNGPSEFTLYGRKIELKDGRLQTTDGTLAGAHLTIRHAVQRVVNVLGLPLESALRMGVTHPAEMMGLTRHASLIGRSLDEVFLLDANLSAARTLCTAAGPRSVDT